MKQEIIKKRLAFRGYKDSPLKGIYSVHCKSYNIYERMKMMKKFIRKSKDPFVTRIIWSFITGEFYCKICKKYYQSRSGIMNHIVKVHDKEIEEKVAAEFPLKKSTEFLNKLEKAKTDDEYFSDETVEQSKSLIRTLLGDDSLCRDEEEKKAYNLFCENCGIRFQSENPSKRFHSPSCASLFIHRKRMEERDGG